MVSKTIIWKEEKKECIGFLFYNWHISVSWLLQAVFLSYSPPLRESLFPAPLILGLACKLFGQENRNECKASSCLKGSALNMIGLLCSYDCCEEKMPPASCCLCSLDASEAGMQGRGRGVADLIRTLGRQAQIFGMYQTTLSDLIQLLSLTNLIILLFLSQLTESQVALKKVLFGNFCIRNSFGDDDYQGLNGLCSNLGFFTVGIFKNTPYTKTRCMQ